MTTMPATVLQKQTWIPGLTAMLAFLSCKGIVIVTAMFPLVSFTTSVNPHVQAAAISLFSLLTFMFIIVSYRYCHANLGPVILGGIGAILVVATMYLAYNQIVETIGLAALMVSALWSWWASRGQFRHATAV